MITVATVFAISMLSNAAKGKGSVESLTAELTTHVNSAFGDKSFSKIYGSWELFWGPYVYQAANSDVADNAILIAHNKEENAYVLAIAATNPKSKVDWIDEDAAASDLVLLPDGDDKAQISSGTNIGLAFLSGLGGANNTALDILKQDLPNKETALLFITGHSLAGALSPALGTSLFNPVNGKLAASGWDRDNLFLLPTAGPSVGNADYNELVMATFPSKPENGFNQLHFNTLDAVPQAWDPALFNGPNLINLYGENLAASTTITNIIAQALTIPPSPNPYVQLPAASFIGVFQPVNDIGLIDDTAKFLAQIVYQHIGAYVMALAPELAEMKIGKKPICDFPNPFTDAVLRGEINAAALYLEDKYGK